jgi:hypothetical protein
MDPKTVLGWSVVLCDPHLEAAFLLLLLELRLQKLPRASSCLPGLHQFQHSSPASLLPCGFSGAEIIPQLTVSSKLQETGIRLSRWLCWRTPKLEGDSGATITPHFLLRDRTWGLLYVTSPKKSSILFFPLSKNLLSSWSEKEAPALLAWGFETNLRFFFFFRAF